jgi:hypothetical protein
MAVLGVDDRQHQADAIDGEQRLDGAPQDRNTGDTSVLFRQRIGKIRGPASCAGGNNDGSNALGAVHRSFGRHEDGFRSRSVSVARRAVPAASLAGNALARPGGQRQAMSKMTVVCPPNLIIVQALYFAC